MRSEILTDTAPEVHGNENSLSSARYASDASHALYAASYASSPAAQMSRTSSFHSVQSGISSSERDRSERNRNQSSSDKGGTSNVSDATDVSSSDKFSYSESDRAASYCAGEQLAIDGRPETPATLSRFPKALELIKNELPDLAMEAALAGKTSVIVLFDAEKRGGGSDPIVDEQIRLAIAGVEAQGFGVRQVYMPINPCVKVATIKAYWDSDHHPELVKVNADVLRQRRLDAIAARPPEPDHCAAVYSHDASVALDDGRLPDALQLLQDCAAAANVKGDPATFKRFVRSVYNDDDKRDGLDMELHMGSSWFNGQVIDGFEIK
ncbi:MAG: hypothetical protein SFV17_19725 [Candidatus Obscuribacter sp.]|nr:hypothetical protein [Candidatus Obscuribacter sp.]